MSENGLRSYTLIKRFFLPRSGFVQQFIIATVDVALTAQNAMIAAESLGLGGVFIGGIRNDPEKVC